MDVSNIVRTQQAASGQVPRNVRPIDGIREHAGLQEAFPQRDTLTLSEEAKELMKQKKVGDMKKGQEAEESGREDDPRRESADQTSDEPQPEPDKADSGEPTASPDQT